MLDRNQVLDLLSPSFIGKKWTGYEVKQLLDLSRTSGKKLLFLWHNVKEEQISAWSQEVANLKGLMTERFTVDQLAAELARAMR